MIKNNELRTGNLVQDRGGKTLRIDWFERHKVCMKMEIEGHEVHPMTEDFNFLEPIPLTEDLLTKFGFVKEGRAWHNQIALYMGWRHFCYNANYFEDDNLVEIKYVHQLQNLYFFLTGEELTTK